ncbi:hypothetical protein KFE25_004719 [Diacronema lutheri]|uniref:Uncharacterized protein n=1 Tax=Diacronema lutheri TaxID=2081491 RepID=A0A8J6CCR1_DIALT|nr:hypothetical protein KFE25_004719 [Diacronema lutheri]
MVERGGGGRPPPTAQSASTRSAGRLRRSSVDDIAQSLVPGFLDVNGAGIILPAPPRECGARLPHAMSEAAAAAACAPHSAASAAATQLLSMLSRTRGELASTRGPFDPDVPNRLAQRLAAARAELRVVRARVVPAALVLAALLLGVGAGLGGWLDAKSVLAAPLVLSLCAPGAVCALLAILPSEPAAARGAALGCALALALVATAAMWDVSERAVQISAARQCELPEPSRSLAQVPPRARWAYELALAVGGAGPSPARAIGESGLSACDGLLSDGLFALSLVVLAALSAARGYMAVRWALPARVALASAWRGALAPFLILRGGYPIGLAIALAALAHARTPLPTVGGGPPMPVASAHGAYASARARADLAASAVQLVCGLVALHARFAARAQGALARHAPLSRGEARRAEPTAGLAALVGARPHDEHVTVGAAQALLRTITLDSINYHDLAKRGMAPAELPTRRRAARARRWPTARARAPSGVAGDDDESWLEDVLASEMRAAARSVAPARGAAGPGALARGGGGAAGCGSCATEAGERHAQRQDDALVSVGATRAGFTGRDAPPGARSARALAPAERAPSRRRSSGGRAAMLSARRGSGVATWGYQPPADVNVFRRYMLAPPIVRVPSPSADFYRRYNLAVSTSANPARKGERSDTAGGRHGGAAAAAGRAGAHELLPGGVPLSTLQPRGGALGGLGGGGAAQPHRRGSGGGLGVLALEGARALGRRGCRLSTLHGGAQPARLGEVDAYIVHSWHDDSAAKWAALESWRVAFRQRHGGREPRVWLDKVCVHPPSHRATMAALPLLLGGVDQLLLLVGKTWTCRLWCVCELLVFLQMGGTPQRVLVRPLSTDANAADELLRAFAAFDVRKATCARAHDRERLLVLLDVGYGGNERAFNEAAREALAACAAASRLRTSSHDPLGGSFGSMPPSSFASRGTSAAAGDGRACWGRTASAARAARAAAAATVARVQLRLLNARLEQERARANAADAAIAASGFGVVTVV